MKIKILKKENEVSKVKIKIKKEEWVDGITEEYT